MKIAIIGSGISGLTSALCLGESYDVTLIEKQHRLGGHTNTINIDIDGKNVAVDTGFIVFNNKNYPMFSNFYLSRIGLRKSNMTSGRARSTNIFWACYLFLVMIIFHEVLFSAFQTFTLQTLIVWRQASAQICCKLRQVGGIPSPHVSYKTTVST